MKTVAALIGSVLLSIVTFIAGVLGATFYMAAPEPASIGKTSEISDLWTAEPTVVARNQGGLERVAASTIPVSDARSGGSLSEPVERVSAVPDEELDDVTTGSVVDATEPEAERAATLRREHVQWCMAKFNSYRAEDGTYQPYNGKRRACVSPYGSGESELLHETDGASEEILSSARRTHADIDVGVTEVTEEMESHIRECSTRYRSYRPADNSYQPYDGGPRRQCR